MIRDKPILANVMDSVNQCESYAEEYFDPESIENGDWFTDVNIWSDGDYRIEIRHGKGHHNNPYRQDLESIIYDHDTGRLAYVDLTRYPNLTRTEDIHQLELLEGKEHD